MLNRYPETEEKGPDPYDPAVRRRNIITALLVLPILVALAFGPALYRRYQQPVSTYPTHAEAVTAQAVQRGDVPGFVPATATDIHLRRHRQSGQRFVRFDYDTAQAPVITRGMTRLSTEAELEAVDVPSAGWTKWWLISSRTLTGGQAEYLQVYEIPSGADRGYLALDPRTRHGYYWSR